MPPCFKKVRNFFKRLFARFKSPRATSSVPNPGTDNALMPTSLGIGTMNAEGASGGPLDESRRPEPGHRVPDSTPVSAIGSVDVTSDDSPSAVAVAPQTESMNPDEATPAHNTADHVYTQETGKSAESRRPTDTISKPTLFSLHQLTTSLKILQNAADSIPVVGGPLRSACGIALELVDLAQTAKTNKEDIADIACNVGDYVTAIGNRLQGQRLPSGVEKYMNDLVDKLTSINARLNDIQPKNVFSQGYHANQNKETIESCKDEVDRLLKKAQFELILDLHIKASPALPLDTL
ncbi:hypothetical protein AX16_006410 [Volvariella volvacea WC 439]|nr:hypothetical protein AX16_006410 [Volvariella volvacea WC 439]